MQPFYEEYLSNLDELHRDLGQSIEGLSPAALDWSPDPNINSLGVLMAHLIGSERFWLGDVVACDPSRRDREAEFRARGLDSAVLLSRLAANLEYARGVLDRLTVDDLRAARVVPGDDERVSVAWALAHCLKHIANHVGHIQVTRELWNLQSKS